MSYTTEVLLVIIPIIFSTVISWVVLQAVLKERLKNVKENLDGHIQDSRAEVTEMKKEMLQTMSSCRLTHSDKVEDAFDYIKRVELNKADRSEVNLIVDTMRRVEQKLDLLIMQRSGQ